MDNLSQIENLDQIGGRIPVVVITCSNCGYFLTINALVAGVRQPPPAIETPIDSGDDGPAEASG